MPSHRLARRERTNGQTLVEFALVFPMALMVIMAVIGGAYLFYVQEAVFNGAAQGARMAAIENPFTSPASCEKATSNPLLVAAAVHRATPNLPLDMGALCPVSSPETLAQKTNCPGMSARSMQQAIVKNKAYICADEQSVRIGNQTVVNVIVQIHYAVQGLAPPFSQQFKIIDTNTQPILSP